MRSGSGDGDRIALLKQYAGLLIQFLKLNPNVSYDQNSEIYRLNIQLFEKKLAVAATTADVHLLNEDIKNYLLKHTSRSSYKETQQMLEKHMPGIQDSNYDIEEKLSAVRGFLGINPPVKSQRALHEFDHFYKIVLVGDFQVGKSCLLSRFVDEHYNDSRYISNIDTKTKCIEVDGKIIKLQMLDSYGRSEKQAFEGSYRGAHAYIVCFDLTDAISFQNAKSIITERMRRANVTLAKVLIVGTKSDLVSQRTVDRAEIEAFANENQCQYIETSAKNNTNVDEAFSNIATTLLSATLHKAMRVDQVQYPRQQLTALLKDAVWHSLTSYARQPAGFKLMEKAIESGQDKKDAVLLHALKQIADARQGPVVKRFLLPNGVRNEQLRKVYIKVLEANTLSEAALAMNNMKDALSSQQALKSRFK